MNSTVPQEDFLSAVIYIALLLIFMVCVVLHIKISTKFLDKKISEEDGVTQDWDKGIGLRCSAYSVAIIWPFKVNIEKLPTVWLARKYARKVDYLLSYMLIGSLVVFLIIAGIYS